jgi:hypothetical protein
LSSPELPIVEHREGQRHESWASGASSQKPWCGIIWRFLFGLQHFGEHSIWPAFLPSVKGLYRELI